MGNDGGSIPKRIELVKTAKKPIKSDDTEKQISQWHFCALSKRPLSQPVVVCKLRKLYNKEAILEHLINKKGSKYGDSDKICWHIRSMNDVQELKLMDNPAYNPGESTKTAPFLCGITQREMNGQYPFFYLKSCGCVISKSGLDAIKELEKLCPICSKAYKDEDQLELYPKGEKVRELERTLKLELIKSMAKNKRKDNENIENETSKKTKNPKVEPNTLKVQSKSKAIQSIFTSSSKEPKEKVNLLYRGTFNRYS